MKSIRWIFPVIILVMAFILWRVYLDMPKTTAPNVPGPTPEQIQLEALTQQINQLQKQLDNTTHLFTLPEVDYYLNVANMHLFILKDVKTALQIMLWVENRLKVVNAPKALQDALAADIVDLKSAATPHIEYITQKIDETNKQLANLPLRSRQAITQPEQATVVGWQGALHDAWSELKSLIRIQPRNASMDYVLFDETILRETLRVELQRASIAAVLGQTDLYQSSLQQALLALKQYFEADNQTVQQAISTLENLKDQVVVPDLPRADRALMWLQTQQQGSV